MDPVIEKKLDELLVLTGENNKMLHKMRKAQQRANVTRILYWIVIIGLALGATYYIKPYINQVLSIYSEGASSLNTVQDLGGKIPTDLNALRDLLNSN